MRAEETAQEHADQVPRAPSVPYRTAFETRLSVHETADLVRAQLRSWLKGKGFDVERFDIGVPAIGPGVTMLHVQTNGASGWQLTERLTNGVTWMSTVAVTGRADQPPTWVTVNVEAAVAAGAAPAFAAPPRLIRLLLDAMDGYDGEALLRSHPTVVAVADVEELLELVCDPRRRLPAVVATTPADVRFESWRATIDEVTRLLPGLASTYLLDPAATLAFNDGIGATHRVGAGAIRTYLPDADPAVTADAVRHRVLGRRWIDLEPGRAVRVLAALPRQLAANSLPPAAARGFALSVRDFVRSAQAPEPVVAADLDLREQARLYEGLLQVADDIERQFKATISQQQDQLLDLAAELEVVLDQAESQETTIRALRARLVETKRYDDAYAPPEEQTSLPRTFGEVLDRLSELAPYVVFTGDPNVCLDLDEQPHNSPWAQVAWQALRAMADYVRAKRGTGFDGDFKRWCEATPGGGRSLSPGKVARDESDTVHQNPRLARSRYLPVPVAAHPDGRIFMGAHIKLSNSKTVAPRIHFHDASAGSGTTIYVGYIGRHLPNTLTT